MKRHSHAHAKSNARTTVVVIASALVAAALVAALVWLPQTGSGFSDSTDNAGNSWAADTLDPPTALTATGGSSVTLNWTATPDIYAAGHRILRSTNPGGPYTPIAQVTPRTTTTYIDTYGASAVFAAVATKSQTKATSMVLDLPAGTAQDDLLIAQISVKSGDPTFATPSGWTLLFSSERGGAGDVGVGLFYRVAGAAEPANYTFTWTADKESSGAMARYSNVDTTTPIDAWATDTGHDSNPLAPDITTTTANTMVIRLFGSDGNETVTNPPATTGRYDISGNSATSAGADATQPAAGAAGTATFTIGSNEKWVAATIALTKGTGETTCYYVVEAYYQSWTSPSSNQAQATGDPPWVC